MKSMHFKVIDKNSPLLMIYGKGADSTITDYLGRHSLHCLALCKRVFKNGKISMGMDINKTWSSNEAIRFNDRFPSTFYGW